MQAGIPFLQRQQVGHKNLPQTARQLHMYPALKLMIGRVQPPFRFPHGLEQKLHITPVAFPLFSQRHHPRSTMQQYHAELIFKRRNLLSDGRLLHPALASGRRKRTRLGDA